MSNSTPPRRPGVRRIVINGRFLDEVQTRVEDDRSGSVIHTSYPAEHHHAIEDENGVTCLLLGLLWAAVPSKGPRMLEPFEVDSWRQDTGDDGYAGKAKLSGCLNLEQA